MLFVQDPTEPTTLTVVQGQDLSFALLAGSSMWIPSDKTFTPALNVRPRKIATLL